VFVVCWLTLEQTVGWHGLGLCEASGKHRRRRDRVGRGGGDGGVWGDGLWGGCEKGAKAKGGGVGVRERCSPGSR